MVWSFLSPLAVPRSRWFRLPFSLVRVRCCFWSPRAAAVSFVLNVGPRLVLVLVLRVRPGFVWSCVVVSFFFSFVRRLVLVDPRQKLGSLRNKLAVFK